MFVHRSIAKAFTAELTSATRELIIGDPCDIATQVGATISKEHAEKILGYIDGAVKEVSLLLIFKSLMT